MAKTDTLGFHKAITSMQTLLRIAVTSIFLGFASNINASEIIDLGTLGGVASYGFAVSSDGNVVVGNSTISSSSNVTHPYRWTSFGGMEDLGAFGGTRSSAWGVSGDGNIVTGWSYDKNFTSHGFRWTSNNGIQKLFSPNDSYSLVRAISTDGSTIAGSVNVLNPLTGLQDQHSAIWSSDGSITIIDPIGVNSNANAVSADGRIVVGGRSSSNSEMLAYTWSATGGIQLLETLGGGKSNALGISADGKIIVGESANSDKSTTIRHYF